jgi:hypothetical protein
MSTKDYKTWASNTYRTHAAKSVSGIALRALGDVYLWVEIARLNSLEYPDMGAHDYYPVGTVLLMPPHEIN